ncbi:MAG: DDE-type integrase/transposase/recombinase [Nanoarchaeota archaeon]
MYPSYDMILHREKLLKEIMEKKRRVNEVAEILGIERETVSRLLAKYKFGGLDEIVPKKPGPKIGSLAVNRTEKELEDFICVKAEQHRDMGPQTLTDLFLEDYGLKIDQSTVYRILKRREMRYGFGYHKLKKKRKAYCLNQPGEELQMDVCFPFGYERKECVYDAVDDCSRYAFAKVMPVHNQSGAIKFTEDVLKSFPFTIKASRTDCGREFGKEFTEYLRAHGIEHRRNPPYTPQHNGKVERYHRTFKEKEAIRWPFYEEREELNYRLVLWLQHYNFSRRHRGLGMNGLTPAQKLLYAAFSFPLQSHLQNVTGTLQLNKF